MEEKNDNFAVKVVCEGLRESAKASQGLPYASDLPDTKLNSTIQGDLPDKIADMLEKCRMNSPEFLNGVLVDYRTFYAILDHLTTVAYDLSRGRRFEHDIWRNFEVSQKELGGFLTGMLNSIVKSGETKNV